jgi:hypothetical protein
MLPRQFKALVQALRDELSSLRQVSSEQVRAIRDHEKAAREDRADISRAIAAIQPTETAQREDRAYRHKGYAIQVILTFATCGAFLAAAIYAGFAWRQVRIMNHTYAEIQKQTKAVEWSAYVACVNALIARNTLIELQAGGTDTHAVARSSILQAMAMTESEAAVVVPDIGLVRLPPGNDLVEIPFEVRNSGKSDAKDVTIKIRGVYLPKGIDPDFSYGAPNVASIHALILTPNETTKPPLGQENTPVSHVVSVGNPDGTVLHRTPQDIGNINDGSATIFVYGDLRYTDVFGVRRWQTFCQALMSVLALHADSNIQTATGPGEKCGNYNKEQSIEAAPHPQPQNLQSVPEIICKKPSDN